MDDLSESIIERETALANFDHARDDFTRAFAQVPEKAILWKPEGDDYTIGDLVPHVIGSIYMYTVVLDTMAGLNWGLTHPFEGAPHKLMEDNAARVQAIYAGGEGRDEVIRQLEEAHDALASRLRDLAYKEYSQKAPVHYPPAEEPFPTSAADILGWLTDHYNEHIAQIWQLIEGWEARK